MCEEHADKSAGRSDSDTPTEVVDPARPAFVTQHEWLLPLGLLLVKGPGEGDEELRKRHVQQVGLAIVRLAAFSLRYLLWI